MKDRQDNHSFWLLDKEHSVRKSPNKDPSNLAMNSLVVKWILVRLLDGVTEFGQETPAKPFKLGFIPVARLSGLNLSPAPYEERTPHESASNLAFTSLHGDPSSGSSRYSS